MAHKIDFVDGGWVVVLNVDSDNHLTVDVLNVDGSKVFDVGEDLSDGNACITRYSTEKIEQKFAQTT